MNIDDEIRDAIGTKKLKRVSGGGSGCISKGEAYDTDDGTIFVKFNPNDKARVMFDGEFESLKVMRATNTVRVPKPLAVVNEPNGVGAAIVMEYVSMSGLREKSSNLGESLAMMHLHNDRLRKLQEKSESWIGMRTNKGNGNEDERTQHEYQLEFIDKFGFDITTCCGYIQQDNDWTRDWPSFFARNRLQYQLQLIEKEYGDREAQQLWSHLQLKIPNFFTDIEGDIIPSLLHGDLWGGNAGQLTDGSSAVIFDPASFYGHSEYELSISKMFGGFSKSFYDAYHNKIKKTSGFERRIDLYQLFHYLNHWNHFGESYRGKTLTLMRRLIK